MGQLGKSLYKTTAAFQLQIQPGPEEERERGCGEGVRALAEGGGALKAQKRAWCFPGGVLFFEVNSSSPALSVSPHATV